MREKGGEEDFVDAVVVVFLGFCRESASAAPCEKVSQGLSFSVFMLGNYQTNRMQVRIL